jgi:shikimate dehydrogenase
LSGGRPLPGRLVLLGHPVAHSLSPRFQNAALARAGIPLIYEARDVPPADLPRVLDELVALGAAGNVTVPHKQAVAARCARRTAVAERAGAVNTFWSERGELVGDNTDVAGVHQAVVTLLGREPRDERVSVVGAGGSAAAVLCAVERWVGSTAAVYNRTMPRAQELVARFAAVASCAPTLDAALADATLVVNATTLGMGGHEVPVPVERLPHAAAVLDLVYAPHETRWVREARAAGHPARDGIVMLVEQGAAAFERWFGRAPDRAAMWAALA